MRSLVTGATGFVGSHVAEVLRERGHSVRLLVRDERRLYPELREGFEIIKGDVTQKPEDLRKAVEGVDYVFHVAGLIKGRTQQEFTRVNAWGTRNLCEAVKLARADIMRFVAVSSQAAVGPSEDSRDVVTEDRTPHPVTYYGRSKLLGEKFAREYNAIFPVTIIRPPTVYGPRDSATFEFFKWMARGYALQFGNQEKVFSMIHGRDLARGIMESAMHDGTIGETFFVTDAEPYPMSWVMELLRDTLKPGKNRIMKPPVWLARMFARTNDIIQFITRRPMIPNSDKMRELMPAYWVCSGEKARQVFGYVSKIPIRDGLREAADWYLKNGWLRVK
ncbi:MAG: NAD(P)-dependent oxidoreductase [Planctomycetes bacterium]|jgi:nucleoside-diphosphate-sugar epimerase|nr:NAD(P)-dependent oxidoreductase [Planctomycetota bacterium]MCL4729026.1 NAD(P)-dependent oxidoreductase [Planctomycetota bacterium]